MQKKHIPISSMGLDGTGIFTWMVDYGKLSGKCVIRGCYGTFFSGPLKSGNKATRKYNFKIKHAYVFSWCFQLNHVSNCAWTPPPAHIYVIMTNLRYLEKIFPSKFNIDTLRYRHDFPIPIVFAKIVGPGAVQCLQTSWKHHVTWSLKLGETKIAEIWKTGASDWGKMHGSYWK